MDMMTNQVLKTGYYRRDPLNIPDLIAWVPTDRFYSVLPTGQPLRTKAQGQVQIYETYANKQCVHCMNTGVSGGTSSVYQVRTIPKSADFGGNHWTVSLWYYGKAAAASNILQLSLSSSPNAMVSTGVVLTFGINSSNVTMNQYNGSGSILSFAIGSLNTAGWNHIVYEGYGTNQARLYYNKSLKTTSTPTFDTGYIGGSITVSNYQSTCRLANIRIYGRQLSSSEITQLYNE